MARWSSEMRGQVIDQRVMTIRDCALDVLGCNSVKEFLQYNTDRVATVTFLGGAGSRWINSVVAAQAKGEALDVDINKPRSLALIADLTRPGCRTPIGRYNLTAVEGIGTPFVSYKTNIKEMEYVVEQSGLANVRYISDPVSQWINTPLGHGHAMRFVLPSLGDSFHFIITNFGGDPNSRDTIITSLLVLAAMQKMDEELRPWGLMPTAYFINPPYPITLTGLAASFAEFSQHFDPKKGYSIPGNKGNDFGLDNIDTFLARIKRFRLLCVARPEEITSSVKEWKNIDGFLASMRVILGV
jgi:hypothetical protein